MPPFVTLHVVLPTERVTLHVKLYENINKTQSPALENSPIRGQGGLSKMSNKIPKMSIIELFLLGQDLFDFSGLT